MLLLLNTDSDGFFFLRSQLAEQYGNDVASEILPRLRSNLQLDTMPTMPYSATSSFNHGGGKYDTLSAKAPEGH